MSRVGTPGCRPRCPVSLLTSEWTKSIRLRRSKLCYGGVWAASPRHFYRLVSVAPCSNETGRVVGTSNLVVLKNKKYSRKF
jgi:hypothetical protein